MTGWAGARRGGLFIAVLLLAAACSPLGDTPDSPTATASAGRATETVAFEAANGSFSIALPAEWNDLTSEYTEQVPETVLAAYWSTGTELGTLMTPFATVSSRNVAPGTDPGREVDEDIAYWTGEMIDAVQSEATEFTTDAGGRGVWRTVSGDMGGVPSTIYSIHIVDEARALMVLIETYMDLTESPDALVDAMKTVRFGEIPEPTAAASAQPSATGSDISARVGEPQAEDGRWFSYCRTLSIAVQADWPYSASDGVDSRAFECSEDWDYLGAWYPQRPEGKVLVMVHYQAEKSVPEIWEGYELPPAVGDSIVTSQGFNLEWVDRGQLTLPGGAGASWVDLMWSFPDGTTNVYRSYGIAIPSGGAVEFSVQWDADTPAGDYDWLIPVMDSLEVS